MMLIMLKKYRWLLYTVFFAIFPVFSVYYWTEGDHYKAVMAWINILLFLLPRFLYYYHTSRLKKEYSKDLVVVFEYLTGVPFILNGLGAMGLYNMHFGYDSFVHGTNGLLGMMLFVLVYKVCADVFPQAKFAQRSESKKFKRAVVSAAITVFALGIFWELYEYYGDKLFTTIMYGEEGEPFDTQLDLLYNIIGALGGVFLIYSEFIELDNVLNGCRLQLNQNDNLIIQ